MSQKKTPILDALESLDAAAGMCGFHASDMRILSHDLFERVLVEFGYRGVLDARTRTVKGELGAPFEVIDMTHLRIYREAIDDAARDA